MAPPSSSSVTFSIVTSCIYTNVSHIHMCVCVHVFMDAHVGSYVCFHVYILYMYICACVFECQVKSYLHNLRPSNKHVRSVLRESQSPVTTD